MFDVEIREGQPVVKLPYNIGDDPRIIAQTFLDSNNISLQFLDSVADFIKHHPTNVLRLAVPASTGQ